jgi:PelA/Pel-15E family pectate lyase
MSARIHCLITLASILLGAARANGDDPLVTQAKSTMRLAAEYYRGKVASHGGYVYHYSTDLKQRWGEGVATVDQIWVQPPGTPTVGMAYLDAYAATHDPFYLEAATDAANALVYGQLKSGGWQNCVDFNPRGDKVNQYRNGKGGGKDNSSLDDGQSTSALLFLIKADEALHFKNHAIHESVLVGLNALLAAQYPNGAFPQVWTGPVSPHPAKAANYPTVDWRTEGRMKDYWNAYTLNDNVPGYVLKTLLEAHRVYQDPKYLQSVARLGDFLIQAQMPQPQRGWAQQYNYDMQPIWARKFEPPAVSGDETQETIENLLTIHAATHEAKYLAPIPDALAWLEKSQLPDGQIARYYELKTNRPLYMNRDGEKYFLTYDDANLPDHYGWKAPSRVAALRVELERARAGQPLSFSDRRSDMAEHARRAIAELDPQGRWVSTYNGERLVGQAKIRNGEQYLSSEVFSGNMRALADYVREHAPR